MAIKSMTGFGRSITKFEHSTITIDIKSVNSKFLEIALRLPAGFKEKEFELRGLIGKLVERGKVDITIAVDNPIGNSSIINKILFNQYYQELVNLKNVNNIEQADIMASILRLPGVVSDTGNGMSDDLFITLKNAVNDAVFNFNAFRLQEGDALGKDVTQRIVTIKEQIALLLLFEQNRITSLRKRLEGGLDQIIQNLSLDRNRFEQELIYYIEKLDITEEKVRLAHHCDYFLQTTKEENCGKKLGFIAQEIGREINTLGAKAADADMQRIVVVMKDELERIKEQLNNIL